jgi:hypothetical protein
VQAARRRKGLQDSLRFGRIVEYEYFAKTIDSRLETERISCPPEITNPDIIALEVYIEIRAIKTIN